MKLRILLADDHEIVRRGVRALLEKHEGWEVCGEASDGRECVEKALQLNPDVVIVDIGMPNLNGLDATRQLLQHDPHFKVIILTIRDSDQVIREALDAGARGFVLKSDAARDLVSAVEALQNQRMFFTPRVNDLILAGFLEKGQTVSRNEAPKLPTLTARERVIAQLLAEGNSSKEVASLLNLSTKAVETHRSNIMRKLSFDSIGAGFLEKGQWLELVYHKRRQKRYRLTPRELEIVSAVVAGYSNKEIAESLRISEDVVRQHLRSIFEKCDVSMRLKLARLAVGVDRVSDCVEYLREMKSTYDVHRLRKVGLTPLELEIVAKVAAGCSSPEIADRLKMNEDQLEQYLKNIISKLGDPEEGDEAGIAVKKPNSPNSDSGSATASLDEERRI